MFEPGDQIAYVPTHAEGDTKHPDCQYGFVVKKNPRLPGTYFCRYYYREHIDPNKRMRTITSSENTDEEYLVHFKHTSYTQVAYDWMRYIRTTTGDPLPIALEDWWQGVQETNDSE